jgi:hypothetical protein
MSVVKWSDHFFFERQNCSIEDIENSSLLIELRDKRFLVSDSLIGSYAMDLTYVYFQPNHSIIHKWIALANAESADYSAIKGYLKLGIAVLGEGDEQVDLAVAESGEMKDEDMLLPPQIQPKACQIVIRAVKAEGLPKMDIGGTIDAYLECEFAGSHVKSRVVTADEANYCVEWYEDLYIPAVIPTVSGKLRVRLWDYDAGMRDDLVGTIVIDFEELLNEMKPGAVKRYGEYFWANIYGAPVKGTSGSFRDKMNADPRLASYWRGRVLLNIKVIDTEKPRLMVQAVTDPTLKKYIDDNYDGGTDYELRCQVYSGACLPQVGKQLKVMAKWGQQETSSMFVGNVNGACEWYEMLKRKIINSPSENFADLPDVFIYLMQDDTILSYMRLRPQDCRDIQVEPDWMQLIPDKSTGVVDKDWEAGFIRLRVYVGRSESGGDQSQGGWSTKLTKTPVGNKILLANIFQCRNLPSADSNGKADPYVVVKCGASEALTGKKERMNNLNPIWYRTLALPVTCNSKTDAPPIVIQVWDYDTIGSDDLMGMYLAKVRTRQMQDASDDYMTFQKPHWCRLYMGMSSGLGEILVSFNLVSATMKPLPAFDLK